MANPESITIVPMTIWKVRGSLRNKIPPTTPKIGTRSVKGATADQQKSSLRRHPCLSNMPEFELPETSFHNVPHCNGPAHTHVTR